MSFSINGREIGEGNKPYFVAEMSGNHNNDIYRALKIIDAAKEAGADAIKMQTYKASTITIDHDSDEFILKEGLWKNKRLYELYEEASTPWEWHKKLFDHARNIGITIFSSPFDFTAVDFLEDLNVPAYKIASPEIIDLPLIKKTCDTKKPLILSTGAASINEISETVNFIKKQGLNEIILLHCTAAYPAPVKEANLSTIRYLKDKFHLNIGLSDHTLGIATAITAISLGAVLIEKHFTLSRSEGGVDSSFSLEPKEFSFLVESGLDAYHSIGNIKRKPSNSEKYVEKNRKSLYVVKDIKKGEEFTEDNIRSIRPSRGLKPKHYFNILGKKSARNIYFGEPVSEEMILEFNPKESIKSKNIILRKPIQSEDELNMLLTLRNSEEKAHLILNRAKKNNIQDVKNWLNNKNYNFKNGIFIIYEKIKFLKPIGYVTYLLEDEISKVYSLGICISERFQGKGYGKVSINSLIQILKNNFDINKFIFNALSSNTSSRSLFNSLGFREIGVMKKHFFSNGKWHDVIIGELIIKSQRIDL